ncbi:FecR domain-containing protein [Geobacter anodireducens]|uniref:LysM domain-containing protein n=1 Tax=Geobacter soli TaxID=1510391 RepID=A0A0C1TQQ0_9BACT|nr:FecR domain-containing protein [Geobacter soli]KIE43094.1 hypothetical protein SE37_10840 [Geobacter soli]
MASHTGAAGNGSVPAQGMGGPAGDGIRRLAAVAVLLATLPASVVAARCEPSVEITVSPGDTLLQLCGKHLENPGRCPTIARLNHLQNPDLIHPGQRIRIPAALFRGTGLEGVITFLSGDVRLEGKGGIIEQLAGIGGRVPAGGRLVTGVTGAVEVGYEDGSSFLMRGNGSVDVVRALRRDNVFFDRELLLGKGNLITRIKRATGREQRFEIRTPSAVAGARGTEFRVGVGRAGETRTEVLEGRVGVDARGREVPLAAGEGTLVRAGEPPLPPQRLLAPPGVEARPALFRSGPVRFAHTEAPDAAGYRVMVARDGDMKELVYDALLPAGEPWVIRGLADGAYHLSSRSVDRLGLEGAESGTVPFTVRLNPLPPFVKTPRDGERACNRSLTVGWLKVHDAVSYRLQVAGGRSFSTPVIDRDALDATEFETGPLNAGTYFVRLGSIAADGYRGEWTNPVEVTVVPPPAAPEFEETRCKGSVLDVRVRAVPGARSYCFQLARDRAFAELLGEEVADRPAASFPLPTEPGEYFVRTAAIDGEGCQGDFSPPRSFQVNRSFPYGALGILGVAGLLLGLLL